MSGEVEVVEVAAANSFLPNLTICVDKEEDDTDLPKVSYTEEKDEEEEINKPDVKLKMTMFPRKKIYENKRLEVDSSLGLTPSEARRRREKRAKRFASPLVGDDETNHPEEEQGGKEQEWEEEGEEMRERVKIIEEHVAQHNLKHDAADDGYIRTNALHLRGVDNMSTDDIFGYFGRMDPKRIEWIDDSSCNVVWGGGTETAQAYHRIVQNPPTPTPVCPGKRMDDDDDTIDLLEDEEPDTMDVDTEVKDKQDPIEGIPVEVNSLRPCNKPFKTTVLEVRYARLGDRKVLGAAKRSKYYLNHGNPNYGGTKGLLSSSFRKRYQMNQARKELGDMNIPVHGGGGRRNDGGGSGRSERSKEEIEDDQLIESSAKDLTDAVPVQSSGSGDSDHSDGYGTMVADQVAQKVKAARTMNDQDFHLQVTTPNSNVRSRLGKRSHESNSNTRNGSVFDRLPPSLRNRLGNKQSGNPPVEPRHNRPPGGSKMRMDRRGNSPMLSKRVKGEGRSLKRYSPTPWSESDEDLF